MFDTTTDRLLSVPEIADFLKISVWTVQQKCRDRVLPAMKIGKYYRVAERDLNSYLVGLRKEKLAA